MAVPAGQTRPKGPEKMEDSRFGDNQGAVEEWQAFLADKRHSRYEDTPANWDFVFQFLKEHTLFFDRESLHFTYATLRDTLELKPFAAPVEQPPTPTPVPTAPTRQAPPIVRHANQTPFL